MIDPGNLNTRLTIEAPVEMPDGQGGVTRSYATFAKAWAQVTQLAGRHDPATDADGAAIAARIVMRSNFVLTRQHRLLDGAQVYRIVAMRDRDGGRFIEIDAELRVE